MESRGQAEKPELLRLYRDTQGKDHGAVRPGRRQSGKPEAFHTYSMRQAIQEGFILDVLQRYTTYKTYYNLLKETEEDPSMPKKKAIKKLTKFLYLHPYSIEQKTEIIVEHFRQHVRNKLRGRAKAMVVTGSRLHAVRYMLAFQKYIAEHGYIGYPAPRRLQRYGERP